MVRRADSRILGVALPLLLIPACGGEVVGYDPDGGPWPDPPPDVRPLRDVGPDVEPLPPEIPCSEEGTWVYVISHDHGLYRFDPPLRHFTLISELDCPTAGRPFSMAVSRSNIAYVLFYDPGVVASCVALNAVDVVTGECLGPTGFDCGNAAGFELFGMGYATLGPETGQEKLYIMRGWSDDNVWLASLEPQDGTVIPLVPIDAGHLGEMTGNSRGELFAYFNDASSRIVARLDVTAGEIFDEVALPQTVTGGASAVAYWGGSFYVFASESATGDVYRVTGATVTHHTSFPFSVVGAGVSTCAPSEQPDGGVDGGESGGGGSG
jgi:hypothetical protein